jgi:phosphoribosylamine-glycine ligase
MRSILVIGGGGREHAIVESLAKTNNKIFACPGIMSPN